MHMADVLLSPVVGMTMNALSVTAIGVSVAKVKKNEIGENKIPIMGVAGALVFAGQMINFAIPMTGSSGHIGGGILLAGLLGSIPAFLSMAAVIIIQCLFFADGGLLALGSNIFVLGVVPCLIAYPLIFKPLLKGGIDKKRLSVASVVAVMAGLELGAFFVVALTMFSGITALPFGTFLALMLPIHLAIGLAEGVITAAILSFVHAMRPEIIDYAQSGERLSGVSTKKVLVALAVLTVVTACALSLFVSANPDGLEWSIERTVAQTVGSEEEIEAEGGVHEGAASIQESTAFLPDYAFEGDPENAVGTTVSGLVGTVITFAVAGAAGFVITKVKKGRRAKASV